MMKEMSPGMSENEFTEGYTVPDRYLTRVQLPNGPVKEHLAVRRLSEMGSVSTDRKSAILLGVILTEEMGFSKCLTPSSDNSKSLVLGTVCVEDVKTQLDDLRNIMCNQIPCVPANFTFLTKEGWPILKKQETLLKTSHLITEINTIYIRKQFDKQKIGIVVYGGNPIGFVFADMTTMIDLRQLRDLIEQQLKMSQHLKMEYRFIEKNGWPVMQSQESLLTLVDVIRGQIVYIQTFEKIIDSSASFISVSRPVRPTSIAFSGSTTLPDSKPQQSQDTPCSDKEPVRKKRSLNLLRPEYQFSTKGRKESQKRSKLGKTDLDYAKPILISYVRAEAVQYALELKKELVGRGFSVYLDVHEIKTGSDWQDSLNFAVTHCFLFVPLITQMYGETQWTNREIKLADVLGKLIIPVNFLDHWPPRCLAIQFASTQYIPWKLQDSEHVKSETERISDPRVWPRIELQRAAVQIAECYKENCGKASNGPVYGPMAASTYINAQKDLDLRSPTYSYDDQLDAKKHSVVISAHPKQKQTAHEVKTIFENKGYSVWCSINWQESQDNLSSPNTPHDLPPITEGEVFFNGQQDYELGSVSSSETKKSNSAYKEPEIYGRRPLSRMMSQFSDISKPFSLTGEKLDRLRIFQHKVDQAGVVIVLVSEEYTKSTFSQQQVFYCEHRKRLVMVKCDNAQIPKWFKLLMGNDMILKANNPQFECVLNCRVKRALNPSSSETPKDATFEAKINYLVNFMKRNITLRDMRVYVTGSSKLQSARAEEICRAIGQQLAELGNVSLVTNGFFGAPDITAKAFFEYRENSLQSSSELPAVVHILPMQESEDLKSKAQQNDDGTFEPVSYGKTFFVGDTLKERETAVARLVDMCIVIEGGPGVVHEVEEFIWNDHFVIPIQSTGGAAGGKYGIPIKIFKLPPGVDKDDWNVLSDPGASPQLVAKAVISIIFSLKRAMASPTNLIKQPGFLSRKTQKKQLKSKKLKPQKLKTPPDETVLYSKIIEPISAMENSTTLIRYSEHAQQSEQKSSLTFKKRKWWRRIFGLFGR